MNGIYLENLIKEGNKIMIKELINKSREVKFQLLTTGEINNLRDRIELALTSLWELDKNHYLAAKHFSNEKDCESIIDHYFGIDSILCDNVNRHYIAIDWTCKSGVSLIDKLEKQKRFQDCYKLMLIEKSAVVYIHNSDLISLNKKGSFVYKTLKTVITEVNKIDFQGGLTIDVKDLMKL